MKIHGAQLHQCQIFKITFGGILSGSLDSESLGLKLFGQATVSQSPFNQNNEWPVSNNLFATLANDDPSDGLGGSGQDIVSLKASYSENQLYTSLQLNGSCCSGFFGPWNLYVIAIVNPDNIENPVAYAYAFGNGGFGQLYPGIYKIEGDFITGDVGGFEVISTDFDYNTSGNSLQARSFLSVITEDSDWGEWPNSYQRSRASGCNNLGWSKWSQYCYRYFRYIRCRSVSIINTEPII